jgi:hypothetical protein
VQSDYQTRLARVVEQLEAHRHVIDEERTSVQSRVSLLEAEEGMRRDERAELELRAHVGELVGDEAAAAFKAVDDSINQIVGETQGLQARIDELEALLDQRYTPPAPRASGKTVNADVLAAEAAFKEAKQAPAATAVAGRTATSAPPTPAPAAPAAVAPAAVAPAPPHPHRRISTAARVGASAGKGSPDGSTACVRTGSRDGELLRRARVSQYRRWPRRFRVAGCAKPPRRRPRPG